MASEPSTPEGAAYERHPGARQQNQLRDADARSTQSHADGDLLRAQRNRKSHHGVDPMIASSSAPVAKPVIRSVLKRRGASTFEMTSFMG